MCYYDLGANLVILVMFQDSPLFALLNFGIALWLFYIWYCDLKNFCLIKKIRKGALEGATSVSLSLVFIAIVCGVILLAIHTCAEMALGVESEQTKVAPWALLSWISAAFVEELIFRGFLVVKNKGRVLLCLSILFFSFIFAIGHPFVWDYTIPENASIFAGEWKFNFSAQTVNATISIFECSMLFYILRFLPINVNRSIIPCISAHCAYNVGVFVVKAFQGYIAW